jgi:hypothetical protein
MSSDLADLLRAQHADLRALLADLARQPAVTEQILGPQLRARRRLMRRIQHVFLAQTAGRIRYLWPAFRSAWPEGRSYTERAWSSARVIEYRMAKREWYGERDEAIADLEDQIASDIEEQVGFEERQLPRLEGRADRTGIDGTGLARRLRAGGPWPTRPHPDLPRSARLASMMLRPLAVTDRVLDQLARPTE